MLSTHFGVCFLWSLWSASSTQPQNPFGQTNSTRVFHPNQLQYPIPTQVINYKPTDEREDCHSGFSVRKSLRSNLEAKTRIHFEEVLTNAGGWDSEKNEFRATCPGIYFFTFNALSDDGKDFTMALMKNGIYQVTAYGGKASYQWGSNSALLFLNRNDTVYLELQEGTIYEHPFDEAYSTFTGFLVEKF